MDRLRLGSGFADHLVLQRERPIRIWGWDEPAGAVSVELRTTTGLVRVQGRSDASGRWCVSLPAQPASGPNEIVVTGSETKTLRDVWIGEVWLASGQSNMEWTVAQADRPEETSVQATEPRLRVLHVPRVASDEPCAITDACWNVVTPQSVSRVTAVGYHFAARLCRELDVAVGIIDASWGGTLVEAWTSREALSQVMPLAAELSDWANETSRIEEIRAEHQARMVAWETEMLPRDETNLGEAAGWHRLNATWEEPRLRVPGIWQRQGLNFNGVVWFRLELQLEAAELDAGAAGTAVLRLGRVDDFDHTYVNGTLVGSHPKGTPSAFEIEREYCLEPGVLRPGKNVIAVRVFDHVGEGGFSSGASDVHLELASGKRVPLAGDWQYRVEREIPLVPLSVFATCPPMPRVLCPQDKPGALFNGMIAPLLPLSLRGAIWYQGESNADSHATYAERFVAMIRDWRKHFDSDPLSFLYVQLASFIASGNWAHLREAQAAALAEPDTAMAITLDIGDPLDIHPRNKHDVGARLAGLALDKSYGVARGPSRGPFLERVVIEGDSALVWFHSAAGLRTISGERDVLGFELAAVDGQFHKAFARIDGESVRLRSPAVSAPRFVRYAFSDCPDVNLVNAEGLPAEPFRTDELE